MVWHNNDGLTVRFNQEKLNDKGQSGMYNFGGADSTIDVTIDLTDLSTSDAIVEEGIRLPAGLLIKSAAIITDEVKAGGSAIDVGLVQDDRSTEVDYNGFVTAKVVGAVGAEVAGGGALIGTVVTTGSTYVTAKAASTLFTAGKVRLQLVVRKL